MNTQSHWKRRALHGLALLAVLAVALGAPSPALAAPPPNDEPAGAINIPTAPATLTMSEADFNGATPLSGSDPTTYSPSCVQAHVHSVWYAFMPAAYGQTIIDTFGSGPGGTLDTVLALWSGSPGNLQEIACNDDTPKTGTGNLNSEIKISLRPGIRYYIQVAQTTQVGGAGLLPSKTPTAPRSLLASETYLILNVKFASAPTARIGMHDNKSAVWKYTGAWRAVTGAYYYEKSIHRSTMVGNAAAINFDGDGFTLYFMKALSYGRLEVWVDGALLDTIIQTNAAAQYQQAWVSPPLTNGIHTLQLKNAYKYVNVDAVLITAPPDLVDPAPITDLTALPGAAYGSVNLSWTAPGDDGNEGLASAYLIRHSRTPIVTEDDWNAATAVTAGVPAPQVPGASESMTVSGLAPGLTYYFAIRAQDEQGNLGDLGNSPSAEPHYAGSPAPAGLYENVHPNWMYFGTWSQPSSVSASGGNYRLSSKIGNSAAFVFEGIKFTLLYGTSSTYGNLGIYVDGQFVGNLNQKDSVQKWKQKYYGPLLPPGQHTVQLVHASGARVNLDAILVIDTPDTDKPAPVGSLTAVPGVANGSVNLSWIAPVEDEIANSGEAAYYRARYSLSPIVTETDWNNATLLTAGVPALPKTPGQAESMVASGLAPGVQYYFAVRAYDDFDNPGPIVSASARAKSPLPAPGGKYDNRDTRFVYTAWTLASQSTAYLSYIHYSAAIGKTASFVFNGFDFKLIYTQNTNYGEMEVWVDGEPTGVTINQYGPLAAQQRWRYSDHFGYLTPGQHTVQFVHASGARVNVDAIIIFDALDTDNPAPVGNLTAAPGTANGSVNLSWIAPVEDNGASSGAVDYYLARYSLDPIDDANWDTAAPLTSGIPTPPKVPGQVESMIASGLTPGVQYYFAVRAYDEFDNAGAIVSASARAQSPLPAPAGFIYDNRDSRFLYSAWTLVLQSGAYQNYIHYSTVIGKTATFVFDGSDFSLIYTQNAIYGELEVWVDGVNTGCMINQNGALTAQRVWRYSDHCGGALSSGQHTVVFRHASGARINVDAIEIFP